MLSDLGAVIEAYSSSGGLLATSPLPEPSIMSRRAQPPVHMSEPLQPPRAEAHHEQDGAGGSPPPREQSPPSPRKGRKPARPRRMAEHDRSFLLDDDVVIGYGQAPAPVRSLMHDIDLAERIAHAINARRQGCAS